MVTDMRKISLRRLLTKLTVIALAAGAAPRAYASDEVTDVRLAVDHEHLDPRDAAVVLGRGLALALDRLSPLEATHLASTWALAADPVRRAAVANALEWMFPLVGDSLVLDQLSRDPDAKIRAASARAAWVSRYTGGDPGVLDRLVDDPDPDVRAIALQARSG